MIVEAPCACPKCGGELEGERTEEQWQEEMPEPRPIRRRFVIHVARCKQCGRPVRGRHPLQTSQATGAAAAQVGPEALSQAARLHYELGLSMARRRPCSARSAGSASRGAMWPRRWPGWASAANRPTGRWSPASAAACWWSWTRPAGGCAGSRPQRRWRDRRAGLPSRAGRAGATASRPTGTSGQRRRQSSRPPPAPSRSRVRCPLHLPAPGGDAGHQLDGRASAPAGSSQPQGLGRQSDLGRCPSSRAADERRAYRSTAGPRRHHRPCRPPAEPWVCRSTLATCTWLSALIKYHRTSRVGEDHR